MIGSMVRAGFVLVGGKSSRMGRDKALLQYAGTPLVRQIAQAVFVAAGSISLVGSPERYGFLGFPVIPDRIPDRGPLSGIEAALSASASEWNLIVACDMPQVSAPFLGELLDRAAASEADCVLPQGPSGMPEPLCAAYHARCLPAISAALLGGVRKVTDALTGLRVSYWPVSESHAFRNVNTPQDWSTFINA